MEKEVKINSEQFFDLLKKEEIGWQSLIYELIRTERLDPWDIDIAFLSDKYLETIQKMEEANFFISSKMLLACAILLKMKSEILNSSFLRELDEIIYGKKEEKKQIQKIIENIEEEFPLLIPRTPLPRQKKVSLEELMFALNKAIETETRRIKKLVKKKHSEKITRLFMPSDKRIPLKERINIIFKELEKYFNELKREEITFSDLAPTREQKKSLFLPILQLDNHKKIYIKQYNHFEEIFIKLEKYGDEELELLEENRND